MTENEVAAIVCTILTPIIAGYFVIRNARINKRNALEQQFEDLKAEMRKCFAVQDVVQQQTLKEVQKTNGSVKDLLEWKEKANEIHARHSEKISYLEKK